MTQACHPARPADSILSRLPAAAAASPAAAPFMTARLVHALSRLRILGFDVATGRLALRVEGEVPTLGWSGFRLDRRIYVRPPIDGVYEADLVGMRPGGGTPDVRTPFVAELDWPGLALGRVRGLRVRSATNALTARIA